MKWFEFGGLLTALLSIESIEYYASVMQNLANAELLFTRTIELSIAVFTIYKLSKVNEKENL